MKTISDLQKFASKITIVDPIAIGMAIHKYQNFEKVYRELLN